MSNNLDIKRYDKMAYKSSIVDIDSYVNSKLDTVHNNLFMAALEKAYDFMKHRYENDLKAVFGDRVYSVTLEEFLSEYKMKELKSEEYFMPSKVIFKRTKFPYDMYEVDLKDYWDDFPVSTISKGVGNRLSTMREEDDYKIAAIDYVNGRVKLKSRMTGNEEWVPAEYITEDIELHEDMALDSTFTEKLKNSID